jgi:hypothetical protein
MKNSHLLSLLLATFIVLAVAAPGGNAAPPNQSGDESGAIVLKGIGCNSAAFAPVPGTTDLFLGRQRFKADGSPVGGPDECGSGPHTGLVLVRLDWGKKAFSLVKGVLPAPSEIKEGPMRGAIFRSAYDPDIVIYHGEYLVSFECTILNKENYGIEGVSACIGAYDPARQEIDLRRTNVVVSGKKFKANRVGLFRSASVPHLLVFKDRLFLYWGAIEIEHGHFKTTAVEGAELAADGNGFYWVKGVGGLAYSGLRPAAEVWVPEAADPTRDTAVGIRNLWVHDGQIIALGSVGGGGCTDPKGSQPGCFRMALAEASNPLGNHIFNRSPHLDEAMLPTGPTGYVRPIKNPDGGYSFLGIFYRPTSNGLSETRPALDWSQISSTGALAVIPFADQALWPAQ